MSMTAKYLFFPFEIRALILKKSFQTKINFNFSSLLNVVVDHAINIYLLRNLIYILREIALRELTNNSGWCYFF